MDVYYHISFNCWISPHRGSGNHKFENTRKIQKSAILLLNATLTAFPLGTLHPSFCGYSLTWSNSRICTVSKKFLFNQFIYYLSNSTQFTVSQTLKHEESQSINKVLEKITDWDLSNLQKLNTLHSPWKVAGPSSTLQRRETI